MQTAAVALLGTALYIFATFAYAGKTAEKVVAGYRLAFTVSPTGAAPRQPERHAGSMRHDSSFSEETTHFALTIRDAKSGKRVEDADVVLYVVPKSGAKDQELDLDAMRWDDGLAYGTYFRAPKHQRQWLLISVHRRHENEVFEAFIDYPFSPDINNPKTSTPRGE